MTKRLLFLLTSILLAVAPVWYFAGTGASLPEDLTIYIATDLHYLEAEARWYFEEVARLQVRQQFAESGLSADAIELLAETFARINSAYFSGERLEAEQFAEGLALWYEQEHSFIHTYMETMLESCSRENRLLKIR